MTKSNTNNARKKNLSDGEAPHGQKKSSRPGFSGPTGDKITAAQKRQLFDFGGVPKVKRWEACYNVTPYVVTNALFASQFTDTRVVPSGHKISLKNHPDLHYCRMFAETIMMAEFRALEVQKIIEIAPGSGYARRISQLKMWQQKYLQDESWKETPPPMDYYVVQPNLNPYDQKYLKGPKKVKPLVETHFTVTVLPSRKLSDCVNLPGGYYYLGNVVYYMRKADWMALWGKEEERATKRVAGAFAYALDPLSDEGSAFGMKWHKTPNKKQTVFTMDDGAMWGHPTDWYNRLSHRPSIAWQKILKDPDTGYEIMHTLYYFDPFFTLKEFRDYDEDPLGFISPSYTPDTQVADLFGIDVAVEATPSIATGTIEPVAVASKPTTPPPKLPVKEVVTKVLATSTDYVSETTGGKIFVKPNISFTKHTVFETSPDGTPMSYTVDERHFNQVPNGYSKVPTGQQPDKWAEMLRKERLGAAASLARMEALDARLKAKQADLDKRKAGLLELEKSGLATTRSTAFEKAKTAKLITAGGSTLPTPDSEGDYSSASDEDNEAPAKPPRRRCTHCYQASSAVERMSLEFLELKGRSTRDIDRLQDDLRDVVVTLTNLQTVVQDATVAIATINSTPAPVTAAPQVVGGTTWTQSVTNTINGALPVVNMACSIRDGLSRKAHDVLAPYANLSSYIYPTEQSADDLMKTLFPVKSDLDLAEKMSNLFPIEATGNDKDQYVRSFARDKGISFPKAADIAHKIEPAVRLAHSRLRGDTDWSLIRSFLGMALVVSLFTIMPVVYATYTQHHLVWRLARDSIELITAFFSQAHLLGFIFFQLALFVNGYNKTALSLGALFLVAMGGSHPASWLSYTSETDFYSMLHSMFMRGGFDYANRWMNAYPALAHITHQFMHVYNTLAQQNELLALIFLHCLNPFVWVRAYVENVITLYAGPWLNIFMDTIVWGRFSMAATGIHMIVWKSKDPVFSTMLHVFYNAAMYHQDGAVIFIWLVGVHQWLLNFKVTNSENISKYYMFAFGAAVSFIMLCSLMPDRRYEIPRELCNSDIIDSKCWSENATPKYDNSIVDWCNHILYNNTLCDLLVMPVVAQDHWYTVAGQIRPWDMTWFQNHPASWVSTPMATLLVVWWNRRRAEPMVTAIHDHIRPSPLRGLTIAPVCAGLKEQNIRPGAKATPPLGKCNHTSPGYTLMGPRLSMATVYCFKGCTCNAWQAMGGRMGGTPKRYQHNPAQVDDDTDEVSRNVQALWQRMRSRMMGGSSGAPITRYRPVQLTRQQWGRRYTAKQARRMHDRWLISDGSDCYSAFVKAEKSMLHDQSPADLLNPLNWGVTPWGATANAPSLSDPRGISVPHVAKRYKLGPEADKFNKILIHMFRGQVFYACGSTPEDIGRWAKWIMDNHEWGLSVMGDDVLHLFKRDGVWFVESLDISRYDMHIRPAHIMITTSVMASLGLMDLAQDLRRMSLKRQYIVSGPEQRGTLTVKGTRASGDPDTISSNSFITMLVAWDGKMRGVSLKQAFWDAGFVVTIEEDTFESGKWDYLQKLFYPAATAEGFRPAPKIGRFIARAFWSRTPYTAKSRPGYCRGVALSLEKDFHHVPIASALIQRILVLTTGVVPKYDVDFKKALEYGHFARERADRTDAVYEFIHSRYGLTRSDVLSMEERISVMNWDEFIDDDATRHLFSKLLVDL